jgi:alpha-glucosidase
MNLAKRIRDIRWIGLGTALAILKYTIQREIINLKYLEVPSEKSDFPTVVLSSERIDSGVTINFNCGSQPLQLEVIFLTSDLVRISWSQGIFPLPFAIACHEWSPVRLNYQVTDNEYILSSANLTVSILADGGIRFATLDGTIIREDLPPVFRGSEIHHRSLLEPDDAIFGLGERSSSLNLRGGKYSMWNTDPRGSHEPGTDPLYLCMPVYLTINRHKSSFVFYENSYPGTFTFTETTEVYFSGGMLRYYFTSGSLERIYHLYAILTGMPPLPPKWALGYHQSHWGYRSASEIRQVINGFKEKDIPISAIHLDIDYMKDFKIFTIDDNRFPNLGKMVEELNKAGIEVVAIIDPGIKADRKNPLYNESLARDLLCTLPNGKVMVGVVWPGSSVFPDFTNPEARTWWASQYKGLMDLGVSGIWHDMNEPTSFTAWGQPTLPESVLHDFEGRKGNHYEAHNLYGLLMCRAGYDAFLQFRPNIRPWILTRSGWAGIQRYAWSWTADTKTCWQNLHQSLVTILGLSLSGQPFSGSDIGGFNQDTTPELYLRWMQLSTFLPFFRTHSSITTKSREPWIFGEPTLSIVRDFIKLRYAMLPYIYTLAWTASQNGTPVVRPFFWESATDPLCYDVDDVFFLGNDIFIAPIFEERATTRSFQLPDGRWYDYWDHSIMEGPGSATVQANLKTIPILVREMCILPTTHNGELLLTFFAPARHSFTEPIIKEHPLYSDNGIAPIANVDDWRLDTFTISIQNQTIIIERTEEGRYAFPYVQIYLQVIGLSAQEISVDDCLLQVDEGRFKVGLFKKIVIPTED